MYEPGWSTYIYIYIYIYFFLFFFPFFFLGKENNNPTKCQKGRKKNPRGQKNLLISKHGGVRPPSPPRPVPSPHSSLLSPSPLFSVSTSLPLSVTPSDLTCFTPSVSPFSCCCNSPVHHARQHKPPNVLVASNYSKLYVWG